MPVFEPPDPPKPHDGPLVSGDNDCWHNACLNPYGTSATVYATGYLEAARVLVEHVGRERSDLDHMVYPIVFLYRQYVELMLKYLVSTAAEFLGEEIPARHGHSLVAQWRLLPELIHLLNAQMRGEPLFNADKEAEIERLVKEFDELDRTSIAFRYPVTREGEVSIKGGLLHLNVRRFSDAMDRLAHLLDELTTTTDFYYEYYGPEAGP